MDHDFRIRPIAASEAPHVARLWRRARGSAMAELEARLGRSPEEDLGFFRDVIMAEREVWVAERDGEVVAFLALEESSLEDLYVDPAAQNCGIGKALLDFAKARRPEGFELFTFVANTGARGFYEGAGLEVLAFGTSPPPENEPDVKYAWRPKTH